jgi:hypothetical protein
MHEATKQQIASQANRDKNYLETQEKLIREIINHKELQLRKGWLNPELSGERKEEIDLLNKIEEKTALASEMINTFKELRDAIALTKTVKDDQTKETITALCEEIRKKIVSPRDLKLENLKTSTEEVRNI